MPNKKTLAIILHHNTLDITTNLYRTLKPFEGDAYDLVVIDNGSKDDKKFPNAEIVNKKNVYYGGGLKTGFNYFKKNNNKYDSLLFMNSDIVVFGQAYVKILREALFSNPEFKLISPSLIGDWNGQPPLQMHKHMNSWGSKNLREVMYVDFETPMFHEDFVMAIDYPDDLMFGVGQDLLSGKYCADRGWKVGVVDWVSAFHYWAHTIRTGNSNLKLDTFASISTQQLSEYAEKVGLTNHIVSCFEYGSRYTWDGK